VATRRSSRRRQLLRRGGAGSAVGAMWGGGGRAGAELEVLQLRTNAEAQAFALQGVEWEGALGEELLRAKAQVAELRAEIRIRDAALTKLRLLCWS
jgi:hypothetical protein